jgi:lysozyme
LFAKEKQSNLSKQQSMNGLAKWGLLAVLGLALTASSNPQPAGLWGIDISAHQGVVEFEKLEVQDKLTGDWVRPHFIYIRATNGAGKLDDYFNRNWTESKTHGFKRGAYHFYQPRHDPRDQADLFIKTLGSTAGDLPPVLDIEWMPSYTTPERLRPDLHVWLNKVKGQYGVQPIIYTNVSYYQDYLKGHFPGYKFWIAHYSTTPRLDQHAHFWQFSDKGIARGITQNVVDLNYAVTEFFQSL